MSSVTNIPISIPPTAILTPSVTTIIRTATVTTTIAATSSSSSFGGFDLNFDGPTSTKYLEDAQHASDIRSQFTICVIAGSLFFMAFCIFRTKIPVLFSPRTKLKRHKPPELPTSLFGWIWPLIKIDDELMLKNVGLDALLMLKFILMSIKIFGVCSIFGLAIFIPITMTSNEDTSKADLSPIGRISMNVIGDGSSKLIAYLVFCYIFTFVTFYFLNQSFNEYIYLRAEYLLIQSKSLVARSVIVTGIPENLRSDKALAEYYEKLGIGNVESCYVVRTVERLDNLIKQRAKALINLEEAYAKYWGNPCIIPGYDPDRILYDNSLFKKITDLAEMINSSSSSEDEGVIDEKTSKRKANATFFNLLGNTEKKSRRPTVRVGGILFGKRVDAIEYYTKLFDDFDKAVIEQRKSPNFELTNVAFVTFEQMYSAVLASQIAIHPQPFVLRTKMAYEPRDVLWSAIAIRGRERIIREIIIWTITVIICITWFIPVGAISSMLSINTIKKLNPSLGEQLENNSVAKLVLNSFVPPLILNIFTSILPIIFDIMGYYQGLKSRSAIAESTLSKLYFFLIFFTLIFYSVAGTTAMTLITQITNDPKKLPEFLADSFPTLAPFFVNYVILQGFLIMPLNLLLLGAIIVRGSNRIFISSTPREYAQNKSPWAFNYGIGYPVPLLVFAIVFEYSLINPLILLFGTVYFCITFIVYKYQFLYVYFRPYEAAGKLWLMTIPRIIFTMVLFQLTMMGLFLLKGSIVLGLLIIPLIAITFFFRYLLFRAYRQNATNVPLQLIRDNLDENDNLIENNSEDVNNVMDSDDSTSSSSEDEEEQQQQQQSVTVPEIRVEEQATIRNRWQRAAVSAVKLKDYEKNPEKIVVGGARPHKMHTLDEDDYRASPDNQTDYRQPPMNLNPGLLDTGLKTYGNPLLVGHLPQLWLPIKDIQQTAEEAHHRKQEFLHRRSQEGGKLAQNLADVLRKMEQDKQQDKIDDARKTADEYAASIVSHQKTAAHKVPWTSLFKHSKKQTLPTPAQEFRNNVDQQDQAEMGMISTENSSTPSSKSTVHHTYYHHPENRPRHRKHRKPKSIVLDHFKNASSPTIVEENVNNQHLNRDLLSRIQMQQSTSDEVNQTRI